MPLAQDPLAVPGVQALDGGEQAVEQMLADRANPEAVAARLRSRTTYERLGAAAAARLVGTALPELTAPAPTGLGRLPMGARLARYLSPTSAGVTLHHGKHAVAESLAPIAVPVSPGRYSPVDLRLRESARGYAPVSTDTQVSVPKSLDEGVKLSSNGVSLTPVDGSGRPLQTSGELDGAAVFYPNSQADTDTAVKATSLGFETYDVLRSVKSPQELSFKIGVPAGARLVRVGHGSGAVRVVAGGRTVAMIPTPSAIDAAGTAVPVSSTLSAGILRLTIAHRAGDYRYPIAVDPTVVDSGLTNFQGNWRLEKGGPGEGTNFWGFYEGTAGWVIYTDSTHQASQWGALLYPTQGESHIYELTMETMAADSAANVENKMVIFGAGGWEANVPLGTSYSRSSGTVCAGACSSGSGSATNVAGYWINAIGTGSGGQVHVYTGSVYVAQNNGPTASFDTTDPSVGGEPNVLYGSGRWLSYGHGAFGVIGKDPGVGVREILYEVGADKWKATSSECAGQVECAESINRPAYYADAYPPDGEQTLVVKTVNGMGTVSSQASTKLKVDGAAPYEITFTGLPAGNLISDANRSVKIVAKAKDGLGTTPSSGVASLKLSIDGEEVGSPSGSCSPGPCTATGEWTISGGGYAAGSHKLVVTATDVAENKATAETTLTVHHAAPMALGPGQVNPVTGEFDLEETDVSVPTASGTTLRIARSFDSREPERGAKGPLGSPWTISFGGGQSIVELPNGDAMLVDVGGHKTVFNNQGNGKYSSPVGDSTLVLAKSGGEFKLASKGTTVGFTHTSGDVEGLFRPAIATGTGGTSSTLYTYQVVGGTAEPLKALAPVPAGVSCGFILKPGCRALTFNYASSTTATGEAPSQWGDYNGRLTRVYFTAYDPVSKAMKTATVAQYSYDSKGRMRAEWDPRVSPALKTIFGYDAAGHVTSVSPAGGEPWIFNYGTSASDVTAGRLVGLTRPPASTELGGGTAPANTVVPALSGSPVVGVRMAVSDGTWSGAPLSYDYQWQRCSAAGTECQPIGGAINANYTPTSSDVGHELVAAVTAIDGGGAVMASSPPSLRVTATAWNASVVQQVDAGNSLNAVSCVPGTTTCVVSDGKGNAYYATNVSASGAATWGAWAGPGVSPSEALSCPSTSLCLLAAGSQSGYGGSLYYATSLGSAWSLGYTPSYGVDAISCVSASFCLDGQDNSGYFRYSTNPGSTSWTLELQGTAAMKAVSCLSTSFCAIADGAGSVHVATSTAQVESSAWTETKVNGTGALNGIACTSTTSCVAVDGAGNVLNLAISGGGAATATKQNIDGTNSLTAVTCTAGSTCVAVDDHGNVFVSADSGATWSAAYQFGDKLTSVSCPSSLLCVTADATGNTASFNPAGGGPVQEGEQRSPTQRTTIEYGVPISGTGAPYAMSGVDVAKWAQTDVPTEATAMLPPDEPRGWPASDYRRATIHYLDASDRVVNVASPGGAIATSEYNSYGDEVRSLTPDNREAALKEGAKSAEVAQTLDTQSTYGSEGTELLNRLEPRHTVKLANGTQAQARRHTVYSYDEGAPAGGPYRLVTKTTVGAQVSGESADLDVRTTTSAYTGENNLGWLLRAPTSVTVDPTGLKLTTTTVYDPTTGNVTETRAPGAGAPNEELLPYVYSSTFGSFGSGTGQMEKPYAMTLDSSGNLWVADYYNSRVEEFSSGGTLLQTVGGYGSGNAQLKGPQGIVIDGKGRVWVADTNNSRIERFSSTGLYETQFKGTGEGELKFPSGIAIVKREGAEMLVVADREKNRVVEFNLLGAYYGTVAPAGTANGQVKAPQEVIVDSSNHIWVADAGNNRVQEFSGESWAFIQKLDTLGPGKGQLLEPFGEGIDSEGNILVADTGHSQIVEFSPSGAYIGKFGAYGTGAGQMIRPTDVILDASNNALVMDGNSRVETWTPHLNDHESSGTGGTHGKQTIYYAAAANGQEPACGEHPEWAGLPCEVAPAAQPEAIGVPNLPVTTFTYDMWDDVLTSTETVGTTTRTTTNSYDEAGRTLSESISSTVGTALPTVTDEYSPETGALVKSSTTVEGVIRSIETTYDKRGEVVSYKDADGNTSTRSYDIDGRPESLNDGKGTQTYAYDTTTGLPIKLVDSGAGAFTAAYDAEGNLLTVGDPNGMNVNHTLDATGEGTAVEYVKTRHCASGCTWYRDSIVPSIHEQALSRASTFSGQQYVYDNAGRLTQVQDTPVGEGCTTRIYVNDIETNRTSLTTRPPGAGGVCATEGGTSENHSYDTANRLTDAGISYDTFGNITKLPAVDAGGSELTSSYYTDGAVASQTQKGETIGYSLDPDGRPRVTVSTGETSSTVTSHYDGEGRAPAWAEDTTGNWTRYIYGFDGLTAIQAGGESPVLQIQDLRRDIVGTASLSETATGLLSKGDSTEYGVPRTGNPPKYSWLGAYALRTELPSGIVAMGARSYVPQIGRFLQPDPVEGGSANAYAYTYGDPIDSADPSGEFTVALPSWVSGFLDEEAEIATEAAIQRAAEEQAAREEAEEKAREAAAEAAEAAAEGASWGGGGGGKGKKGKAGKAAKAPRVNAGVAMELHHGDGYKGNACTGPGPYKCGQPGTGTKPIHKHHGGGSGGIVHEWIEKAGEEIIGAKEQEYLDCIHWEICD